MTLSGLLRAAIVAQLLGGSFGCTAKSGAPLSGRDEAALELLLSIPRRWAGECRVVYLHPAIGSEHYVVAENMNRDWRTQGYLPAQVHRKLRRDDVTFVIEPFHLGGQAAGCLAMAAHRVADSDTASLYVELFRSNAGKWSYVQEAFALARLTNGRVNYEITDWGGTQ